MWVHEGQWHEGRCSNPTVLKISPERTTIEKASPVRGNFVVANNLSPIVTPQREVPLKAKVSPAPLEAVNIPASRACPKAPLGRAACTNRQRREDTAMCAAKALARMPPCHVDPTADAVPTQLEVPKPRRHLPIQSQRHAEHGRSHPAIRRPFVWANMSLH